MDKNLTLTLRSNGKTVAFGKEELHRIINVEGLDGSDYEIDISDNIFGYGGTINSRKIKKRPIVIEAECKNKTETEDIRKNLISFFNPLHEGILIVNRNGVEKYIKYNVEKFQDKRKNLYDPLNFIVDLICPDPFFKDIEIGNQISTWIGGWKFKFKLPFQFRKKGKPQKNIFNAGDVETPVKIAFKGPAVNPKICNLTTKEFVRVKRTLTSDDILYINTEKGNKTIEIERNGTRKNAGNYIDLDSTFFQLIPGDNLIEYSTENNLDPQSVELIYSNKYLGV